MSIAIERRTVPLAEIRVDPRPDPSALPVLRGYASVFDAVSENLGGFREVIRSGAFSSALVDCDCRALVDHDPARILGRTKAGTLRLAEDSRGLRFEIDPPDTSLSRDVLTSIRRGDLDQMSIAFTVTKDTWSKGEDGIALREIVECRALYDVSIVAYSAYPDTSVAVRSLADWRQAQEQPKRTVPLGYYLSKIVEM